MSSLAHPSPHVAERGAIDALRVLLERRALALVDVLDAPVIGAETTSTTSLVLAELTSFREIDSDLLRELVISMLGAFHSRGVEAALWIRGDGTRLRFFLGQYRDEHSAPAEDKFVRTCAEGFLKGAEIRPTSATEAERELQTLVSLQHAAIITGIPSERDETAVQTRLDEALEALAAKRFELLVRLSPVDTVGRSSQPALLDAFEADL